MRPPVLLATVTAVLSIGVLLTTATAAPAGALDPNAVKSVVVGGSSPALLPLQVDRLYPGVGTHARFLVRRGPAWAGGTFAASIVDVEDLERGCNRPEESAGDSSCGGGSDQGELSEQLLVNASWTDDVAHCAAAPVPAGLISMRQARGAPFPASSGSSEAACLVLALQLPFSADNLVQSDLVRFALRIGLANAIGSALAGASAGTRTPGPQASPVPVTTTPASTSATSSPVAIASLISGVAEQPAQASPATPAAQPARGAAGSPVTALAQQPSSWPFTGTGSLPLAGWAALVFAGCALARSCRTRRT